MTIDYGERARALVGTRFRPQGRGPEGLDCVGVVIATFELDRDAFRRNYRLRGDHREEIEAALRHHFGRVPAPEIRAGDLMLMSAGNRQLHLGVRTRDGFVHAHAGIGRVVETPGPPEWPVLASYRRRAR